MKTVIDIDKAKVEQAARLLGTQTLKDTVDAALREVVAIHRRRSLAERVREGTLPAPTPADLARLRAPRVPAGAPRRTK
jgi:Arc/MetJ family transcription regulator